MLIRTTLNKPTYNLLIMLGELDEVVDKILAAGSSGQIDIMNKPTAIVDESDHIKVSINVTNNDYLALVSAYGVKNNRISLRRLLEWFVNEEVYNELGWTISDKHVRKRRDTIHLHCLRAQNEALELINVLKGQDICDKALKAYEILIQLEEEYGKRTN